MHAHSSGIEAMEVEPGTSYKDLMEDTDLTTILLSLQLLPLLVQSQLTPMDW